MSHVNTILKDSSESKCLDSRSVWRRTPDSGGVHQNFTNMRHICGRCKKEYVWDLIPLEKQTFYKWSFWPPPTYSDPFGHFCTFYVHFELDHITQLIFWWIEKSDFDDERQAVSDFRLFGIIIGIFDIVIGSFGNFFTILAFTRSDIQLNMTQLKLLHDSCAMSHGIWYEPYNLFEKFRCKALHTPYNVFIVNLSIIGKFATKPSTNRHQNVTELSPKLIFIQIFWRQHVWCRWMSLVIFWNVGH